MNGAKSKREDWVKLDEQSESEWGQVKFRNSYTVEWKWTGQVNNDRPSEKGEAAWIEWGWVNIDGLSENGTK